MIARFVSVFALAIALSVFGMKADETMAAPMTAETKVQQEEVNASNVLPDKEEVKAGQEEVKAEKVSSDGTTFSLEDEDEDEDNDYEED